MKTNILKLMAAGLMLCCATFVSAEESLYLHSKGGFTQQIPVASLDSFGYTAPAFVISVPAQVTVEMGQSVAVTPEVPESKTIVASSSNTDIATVSTSSIYGKGPGQCVVYYNCEGLTAQCLVTVTSNSAMGLKKLCRYAAQEVYEATKYGLYMGQCLTTTESATTNADSYRYGWGGFLSMEQHPLWQDHYTLLEPAYEYIMERTQDGHNCQLIARTLYLNSLLMVTDMFGVAARSTSFYANNPKFDTQEQIYAYLQTEIASLIADFGNTAFTQDTANLDLTDYDPVFQGDLNKWAAFATALYARFWVRHIPNWDLTTCDSVINYVDAALQSWEDPKYTYTDTKGDECNPWAPSYSTENKMDAAVPTQFFASILGEYGASIGFNTKKVQGNSAHYAADPRAVCFMQPRKGYNTDPIRFRWLEANAGAATVQGTTTPDKYKAEHFPDLFNNTNDLEKGDTSSYQANPLTKSLGYICYITKEELLFDKAEAQYWKNLKSDAYTTMKAGVDASIERYDAWSYIPQTTAAKNAITTLFNSMRLDENNFDIAMLMQQKYVAMYLQPEQWVDVRRYNYSAKSNGIQYDNCYVYHVVRVPMTNAQKLDPAKLTSFFKNEYDLVRPKNLHADFTTIGKQLVDSAVTLTANAWVNRISVQQTYQQSYFETEWTRLGLKDNVDWMMNRMIWQKDNSTGAITNKGTGEWK